MIVTGHDAGKLFQINNVYWELATAKDSPLLTIAGLEIALAAGMQTKQYR